MPASSSEADQASTVWHLDPGRAVAALLGAALLVGGGGVSSAFGNLAVQLVALAVLALYPQRVGEFVKAGPRMVLVLITASVVLPLLQLIPMPPSVWTGLPGRSLVAQSLDLAGGVGWYPLSVHPARTLVAFLGTLAPATVVIIGCTLPPVRLVMLQRLVVLLAVAVALFGTTHLLKAEWGDLYASRRELPGVLVGTFADRNAAALFFVSALLLLVGMPTFPSGASGRVAYSAAGAFLALATVLTGSRTGMVLLSAPVLLLCWRIGSSLLIRRRDCLRGVRSYGIVSGLLLAGVLGGVLIATSGRGQASLARFDDGDGMRAEMRADARFAASRYWPVGAGMGTFDEVFQIDESLEYVSPRRAVRAHMDYLELAIEAGIAGLVLVAGWAIWSLSAGMQVLRRTGAWSGRASLMILGATAAQSIFLFPLRNQAMLCVAALAVVLLARPPIARARSKSTLDRQESRPRHP